MRHDLEEFLEESGLKSGNRRMALYMQEVFAPDAATSDVGVEKARAFGDARAAGSSPGGDAADDNSEELDLDRRAPLAMRIEVAPEPMASPAARPAAGARQMTPSRGSVSGPTPAVPTAPFAQPVPPSEPARHARRSAGVLFIAVFVALAIAAMVFMTLK
jgi:hypothetical protein